MSSRNIISYMHVCVHICMCACIYACVRAYMHVCVHICMCACIYDICCGNWVDFVKSGCEKSWAEVEADSFSFGCRELEVEVERLRQLVVALVGREDVGCASGFSGGQWMIKWGKVIRDMRGKAHLSLGGGGEEER